MSTPIYGRNDLKTEAKFYRALVPSLTHSAALEEVSKWHGFKDWNTASASLPETVPMTFEIGKAVIADLKNARTIHENPDGGWYDRLMPVNEKRWFVQSRSFAQRCTVADPRVMAALLNRLLQHDKVPVELYRMPDEMDVIRDRLHEAERDHPADSPITFAAACLEEFEPHRRVERLSNWHWSSGELAKEVKRLATENPRWSAEDAVTFFKTTLRPFNPNTVQAQWRKFRGTAPKRQSAEINTTST